MNPNERQKRLEKLTSENEVENRLRQEHEDQGNTRSILESSRENETSDDEGRIAFREELALANRVVVFERLIGKSDLLRVNFLEKGLKASKAVGHIDIRDKYNNPIAHGTGFMISPRLMMTNAHVLMDEDEGNYSLVEFDYEDDTHSLPKPKKIFSLKASEFFYREEKLDVAVVAVAPFDIRGEVSLEEFGFLRLRETSGKALPGEHVSIIQHPNGRSKEIACRANKIIRRVGDYYIHYQADTDQGSSGSPVFSDEWEVVALHHAAVRAKNDAGEPLDKNGQVWTSDQGTDEIQWEANEGIRISVIIKELKTYKNEMREDTDEAKTKKALLEDALRLACASVHSKSYVTSGQSIDEERRNNRWYQAAKGYDEAFLGPEAGIPIPDYSSHGQNTKRIDYRNFSIVMHTGRKQALFTACNIDGYEKVSSSKSSSWIKDRRLATHLQLGNEFYKDQAGRKNKLDKGHLVKRTDPCWGPIGEEAIADTYHYTNAALQHRTFNNGIWGRLEDALEGRFKDRTIMSVFTGPVFQDNDPEVEVMINGNIERAQIPMEYWKVIAYGDEEGYLATAAFRQSQGGLIRNMDADFTHEAGVEDLIMYQVGIEEIEAITGLNFGFLSGYEASDEQLESDRKRLRMEVAVANDLVLKTPISKKIRTRKHKVKGGVEGKKTKYDNKYDSSNLIQQTAPNDYTWSKKIVNDEEE